MFLFIFLLLAVCLFASVSRGAQPDRPSVKVTGSAFVEDFAGVRSAVAGAKVKLNGPAIINGRAMASGNSSTSKRAKTKVPTDHPPKAVQELADSGVKVGFTSTTGLSWAKIDDPADLAFAHEHVFPNSSMPQPPEFRRPIRYGN